MLLTVTTTHRPATDLGYLLVKHPDRQHSFDLPTGTAHVFYPQADEHRCTAALLLDVDPLRLTAAQGKGRGRATGTTPEGFTLGRYVNDRPYAASSLLSSALAKVFRSALHGSSKDRPELAATPIPLEIRVPVLRCRGGAELAGRLFAPLGWTVDRDPDPARPDDSGLGRQPVRRRSPCAARCAWPTRSTTSTCCCRCSTTPSTTGWHRTRSTSCSGPARAGSAEHPERALITRRYLAHRRALAGAALARLAELRLTDDATDPDSVDVPDDQGSTDEDANLPADARRQPLAVQRRAAVLAALTRVRRDPRTRPGLRRRRAAGRPDPGPALHRDRRHRRVAPGAGDGAAAAAAGPAARSGSGTGSSCGSPR